MSFSLHCPHCRRQLQIVPQMAGQRVNCPVCGQRFVMPVQPPPPPVPPAAPSAAPPVSTAAPNGPASAPNAAAGAAPLLVPPTSARARSTLSDERDRRPARRRNAQPVWIACACAGGMGLVVLFVVFGPATNDREPGGGSIVGGSNSGHSLLGGPLFGGGLSAKAASERRLIEGMLSRAMSQQHAGGTWRITRWRDPRPNYVGVFVDSRGGFFTGKGHDRATVEEDMLEGFRTMVGLREADPDDRPRFQKLEQVGSTHVVEYELTEADGWHSKCEHTFFAGFHYAIDNGKVEPFGERQVHNLGWKANCTHPDGGRRVEANTGGFP